MDYNSLAYCGVCGSSNVGLADYEERDADTWYIELRCECGVWRRGVWSNEDANRWDSFIYELGLSEIRSQLEAWDQIRFRAQVDSMATALSMDLITPEDFNN